MNYLDWQALDSLIEDQIADFRKINSGIHISLLGTTRGGKTTLVTGGGREGQGLLSHFEDVLVIDSTADPGPISTYGKPIKKYGGIHGHMRLTVNDMSQGSKEKIYKHVQKAHSQGHVAIYFDEVRQIVDKKYFGLGPVMEFLWLFGAKKGTSLIGGTQAPRWVPSAFYEQSKMQFIFGIRDRRAIKRLAEISGDIDTLEMYMPELNQKRWHFAHVGTDGEISVSKFEFRKAPAERNPRLQVDRTEKGLSVVKSTR